MDDKIALIVDDSKAACAVLGRLLKRFSINSHAVHSAELGLEYLKQHKPAIIFMDHSMPDMDGLEAVAIIRQQVDFATIPIYMFTAKSGHEYHEQVADAGANGVVSKTLEMQALKQVLTQHHLLAEHPNTEAHDDVMQEQRMQMWLESFLENKIMPNLAFRLDQSTRETREEMLQNSQKLYRDSLSFHMQQQKQLVNQLEAEKDSLAATYEWSRIKFNRRLTASLMVMLVVVGAFFALQWLSLQDYSQALEKRNANLVAQLQQVSQAQLQIANRLIPKPDETKDSAPRVKQIFNDSGQPVATVVSFSMDKSLIRARTDQGYFFNLIDGGIEHFDGPWYFAAQGCFGTRFIESEAGKIFRITNDELVYTPEDYKPSMKDVFSMIDKDGACIEKEFSVMAVPLLSNNAEITGLNSEALLLR
ncbi:MAG: response regulator [Gammaproteobacteria bacterium]|nr:response regulator [Gammaproteobacteria bacterium]NVK86689.1 response regulator [Gammaproteobacteria bacterium]